MADGLQVQDCEHPFLREMEREMHGALADGWFAFLRGTMLGVVPDAELRERARALAAAGEALPPFDEEPGEEPPDA